MAYLLLRRTHRGCSCPHFQDVRSATHRTVSRERWCGESKSHHRRYGGRSYPDIDLVHLLTSSRSTAKATVMEPWRWTSHPSNCMRTSLYWSTPVVGFSLSTPQLVALAQTICINLAADHGLGTHIDRLSSHNLDRYYKVSTSPERTWEDL